MKLPFTLALLLGASIAFGAPTAPTAPTKPASTPPAATPAKPATTPAKPVAPVAKPVPAKPVPAKPAPPPEPAAKPVPATSVKPGDLVIEGVVGTSLGTLSLAGAVGGEYAVGQFLVGGLPLVYGAVGQVNAGYLQADRSAYQVSDTLGGVAVLGSLHFGWAAISPTPPVRDLDSSLAVGVGVYSLGRAFQYPNGTSVSGGSQLGWGLAAQAATQWFFLPDIGLRLEFGYYACYTALGLGGVYRF